MDYVFISLDDFHTFALAMVSTNFKPMNGLEKDFTPFVKIVSCLFLIFSDAGIIEEQEKFW